MLCPMGKGKRRVTKGFTRTYIREWRKHRGLTLERLAERIESTTATISRIERGRQPYSQAILLNCRAGDLIMRPPGTLDHIEAVFGELSPGSQRRALAVVKALKDSEEAA